MDACCTTCRRYRVLPAPARSGAQQAGRSSVGGSAGPPLAVPYSLAHAARTMRASAASSSGAAAAAAAAPASAAPASAPWPPPFSPPRNHGWEAASAAFLVALQMATCLAKLRFQMVWEPSTGHGTRTSSPSAAAGAAASAPPSCTVQKPRPGLGAIEQNRFFLSMKNPHDPAGAVGASPASRAATAALAAAALRAFFAARVSSAAAAAGRLGGGAMVEWGGCAGRGEPQVSP